MLQAFFDCLKGDKSPQAYWYKGIKNKMMRIIFQRQMLAGEAMDNSANAIYMTHVRSLVEAYAKASTGEAIERAFSLLTLWLSVGRSSETGFLHVDGLNWEVTPTTFTSTLLRGTLLCPSTSSSSSFIYLACDLLKYPPHLPLHFTPPRDD